MSSNLFYSHEEEGSIMKKKDKLELNNWIDSLEFITNELELLLEIEDKVIRNDNAYKELSTLKNDNSIILSSLFQYKNATNKTPECDTMECDNFFMANHEAKRDSYIKHIQNYRSAKTKTLSMILLKAN